MKIAIVDDHQIIIDGIEMLLGLEKNIAILKTYTDASHGRKKIPAIFYVKF